MIPPKTLHSRSDFPQSVWFMCNPLATGTSLLLIFGSFITKLDSTHNILMASGIIILARQIYTRYQFALTMPSLVVKKEALFFSQKEQLTEINPHKVAKILEVEIEQLDPWKKTPALFPGIEIYLDANEHPLTLFYGYGMHRRRDSVFSTLTDWLDTVTQQNKRVLQADQRQFDEIEEMGD